MTDQNNTNNCNILNEINEENTTTYRIITAIILLSFGIFITNIFVSYPELKVFSVISVKQLFIFTALALLSLLSTSFYRRIVFYSREESLGKKVSIGLSVILFALIAINFNKNYISYYFPVFGLFVIYIKVSMLKYHFKKLRYFHPEYLEITNDFLKIYRRGYFLLVIFGIILAFILENYDDLLFEKEKRPINTTEIVELLENSSMETKIQEKIISEIDSISNRINDFTYSYQILVASFVASLVLIFGHAIIKGFLSAQIITTEIIHEDLKSFYISIKK